MSTLHIYHSNVGAKLILRSPLVQLAEQWRDRTGSTEPIVLLTQCKVEELDAQARHYLLSPCGAKSNSESILAFIQQRGGEITENQRLSGKTLTNINFVLPWILSENPESVGEPTERAGVLEIVEFPAESETYIHTDSQIVQAIAKWKQESSFTGPIVIWSLVDTDDKPAHRSTRLLWPNDERHVNSLLSKLEQDRKLKVYLSPIPNPGSFADPWGKISGLNCVIPASNILEDQVEKSAEQLKPRFTDYAEMNLRHSHPKPPQEVVSSRTERTQATAEIRPAKRKKEKSPQPKVRHSLPPQKSKDQLVDKTSPDTTRTSHAPSLKFMTRLSSRFHKKRQ